MNYFVFDNPGDRTQVNFINKYSENTYQLIFPDMKLSGKEMFRFCNRVIDCTTSNDVIICWYDFMGILCWWISKIKHKRRNIVAINILLKDKTTKKNHLAKFLYKQALGDPDFCASVTSERYGIWLDKLLKLNRKFPVIHDVYHESYQIQDKVEKHRRQIFCGGRNGRDWNLMFEIASSLPQYHFEFVMPDDVYDLYKSSVLANVNMHKDISYQDFMLLMCSSSLVALPLDTEAPAGLIVLFQAAANELPIITSDTVTTREYISGNRGILCNNNICDWTEAVTEFMEKDQKMIDPLSMKKFLMYQCSEKAFIAGIDKIVNDYRR